MNNIVVHKLMYSMQEVILTYSTGSSILCKDTESARSPVCHLKSHQKLLSISIFPSWVAALVNFLGYWAGKLPGLLLVHFLGYWAGKLPGLLRFVNFLGCCADKLPGLLRWYTSWVAALCKLPGQLR
jgi:hypothetical protein